MENLSALQLKLQWDLTKATEEEYNQGILSLEETYQGEIDTLTERLYTLQTDQIQSLESFRALSSQNKNSESSKLGRVTFRGSLSKPDKIFNWSVLTPALNPPDNPG